MKRLAIFCVNYNSYSELNNYITSLDEAAAQCTEVSTDVFVVDNTEKDYKNVKYDVANIRVTVFGNHKNVGYFGGIRKGMEQVNMEDYDFHIISNVDVLVEKDFFQQFAVAEYDENIGIVAPQIYSKKENKHRNPGRIDRYSRRSIKIMQFLYCHPMLYAFYYNYVYKFRKPSKQQLVPRREIYLAHGSFIILTKSFYNRCGMINYPVFLYGEEIYLAELSRNNGLMTIYDPSLKVIDIDHVSTGKIKYKRWCKFNHDALTYILDNVLKD